MKKKAKSTKELAQDVLFTIYESLKRIENALKLNRKEVKILMGKVDDTLAKIAEVKAKVIALQQAKDAGGMSAEDEAKVDAALQDLSDTANPTIPNP